MPKNKVKEYREKLGLSQVEVARRAKIHPANLSAIENCRLLPWAKAKKSLARAMKTTETELFPEVTDGNN